MSLIPRFSFFLSLPLLTLALACSGGSGDDGSDQADAAPASDAASQPEPDAMGALPDAAPAGTLCQMKDPITQVGHFCNFEWSQCSSGSTYAIDCRPENIAGMVFSVCDCLQNGSDTGVDVLSSTVCSKGSWQEVEEIINDQCGWDLL